MSGPETTAGLALAQHYLEVENPERALQVLEQTSGVDLEDPEFWLLRAQALYDLDRHRDALDAAHQGLSRDAGSVALHYVACNCHTALGDLEAAERAILTCLELWPDDADFLCRYAHLVMQAGQLDKAERLVDEAARIEPENPNVIRARAMLAYVSGKDRAMGEHSRELLEDDPEDPFGHLMLGHAEQSRSLRRARRHFDTAAELDPEERILREAARESRLWTHPLLLPLWPIEKLGQVGSWIAAVVVITALRGSGQTTAAGIAALVWFVLVVYSWTVPYLLRKWYERRHW